MFIDDQGVSVQRLCEEIAAEVNKYHRAVMATVKDKDPITNKILDAYHKGVLASILIVKEKYQT